MHTDIADAIQKKADARDLRDLFQEPEQALHATLESRVTRELSEIPPGAYWMESLRGDRSEASLLYTNNELSAGELPQTISAS
ncbi:hypothetical protein [Nocardia farcinica]|uniref:hypothetical protein n=1 Tax=Nocardia farcinica TaxID=37329 RepID=UPI0024555425|nr:hypothetical protein [Nocardia farcinica]